MPDLIITFSIPSGNRRLVHYNELVWRIGESGVSAVFEELEENGGTYYPSQETRCGKTALVIHTKNL